ncbi:MAG: PAS domain S-box protein [Candidatus Aquicultor sp.]
MLNLPDTCYQGLLETAQEGILITSAESGVIVDGNTFLIDLIDTSKERLVGKKIWEIDLLKEIIPSKDSFYQLIRNEYVRYDDLQLKKKDGCFCTIEFVSTLCLVGDIKVLQCCIKDISGRKMAEEASSLSEKKYRYLFENNPNILENVYNIMAFNKSLFLIFLRKYLLQRNKYLLHKYSYDFFPLFSS